MNDPMMFLSQFPQFMNQMRGKDPNMVLREMISSGRVSQPQLDHAQQMAQQMQGQFNQFKGMFGFN